MPAYSKTHFEEKNLKFVLIHPNSLDILLCFSSNFFHYLAILSTLGVFFCDKIIKHFKWVHSSPSNLKI